MKILGIDPGSIITGFGLIEIRNKQPHYVASGAIRIKAHEPYLKLKEIYQGLSEIILQYHPNTTAIEQTFMNKNAASALKLGQARGAAMVALAMHDLEVAEYSAKQVKQAVVGYGAAAKDQVAHMVKTLLKLKHALQTDAADALAVALCHFHTQQSLLYLHGATKTVRGRLL
jgi:crossover junction endodeoxyribonuclease RuvC